MQRLVDFSDPDEGDRWFVVDDGVMGGVSQGHFHSEEGVGVFHGELSLEHGGGFSSVRRMPASYPLAGTQGILLRLRGDGRTYQCRVRNDHAFDGIAYGAPFDTQPGKWLMVRLPWSEFVAVYHGRRVPDAPALDPARVEQLGVLLADRQAGGFCLDLAEIQSF
ncbi:CIA30 family protein [Guyparkeria sp. 1SP6A2]|nr:CIA30 family protein [Guyparkeria sp. 1SP6A2]